ncbi:hypothetical protein GF359_01600 [candidate division WOR-3 bacterium]|uniref:VOC family protein n=1 Tax=candidate division WOR-3 bacterium TaxID=2052148 RepID=A0A9D5K7R8_UNCW3|nr:hypothetical protein [candidate division WOR-3 bacterium]MBD3363888.1 hypothetical protein [candidate division WOR-3 bacterium]
MKLGKSATFTLAVKELEEEIGFYEKLGYALLGRTETTAALTDGQIRLSLQQGEFTTPMITYFADDITPIVEGVERAGVELVHKNELEGKIHEAGFADPNCQPVLLVTLETDELTAPEGKARCGIFGEYSIPTENLTESIEFWSRLGFERVGGDDEKPYPWAILADGMLILGLHQTPDFKIPFLTYFAKDMAERISSLKEAGIEFAEEKTNDKDEIVYALAVSPSGQRISLFYAEGFEDGTNV